MLIIPLSSSTNRIRYRLASFRSPVTAKIGQFAGVIRLVGRAVEETENQQESERVPHGPPVRLGCGDEVPERVLVGGRHLGCDAETQVGFLHIAFQERLHGHGDRLDRLLAHHLHVSAHCTRWLLAERQGLAADRGGVVSRALQGHGQPQYGGDEPEMPGARRWRTTKR